MEEQGYATPLIEGIAYYQIKIEGILSCVEFSNLKIEEGINRHAVLYLDGLIPETVDHMQLLQTEELQGIKIIQIDEKGVTTRVLYQGFIEHTKISTKDGLCYVYIQAISNTKLLDLAEIQRSFHDVTMSYSEVLNHVIEPYSTECRVLQEDFKFSNSINKFFLQYKETDWEFLIRITSFLGLCLVPSTQSEKIDFYVGLPKKSRYLLSNQSYTIWKTPSRTQRHIKNELIEENNSDFFIKVKLSNCLFWMELGDQVQYLGLHLIVFSKKTVLDATRAMIFFEYILTTEQGVEQPRLYNKNIIGLSIGARVIDHTHAFVELSLYNEEYQEVKKSTWFRQSVFYAAGDCRRSDSSNPASNGTTTRCVHSKRRNKRKNSRITDDGQVAVVDWRSEVEQQRMSN